MKIFVVLVLAGFIGGFVSGFAVSASAVDEHVRKLQEDRDRFEESSARYRMEAEGMCASPSSIVEEEKQTEFIL